MGKPAVEYSCRGARQGFHRRRRGCVSRRARVSAFRHIFVVHATNVLHVRWVPTKHGQRWLFSLQRVSWTRREAIPRRVESPSGTSYSPNGFEPVFSQGLRGLGDLGNNGDMTSTLQAISTLPAFHIYYHLSFLTQACTCTQHLLASCIPSLNSALSRTKAPSLPIFNAAPASFAAIPYRSLSEALFATGRRLLGFIGHVEVPGIDDPSVQSKVAATSDSGPALSVE
ncbi:hypothetical protein BU17DRAFT_79069 [Hysterangium stoloniferum]|nr:hypothetical protein BU17DRAFT_79069 [Hysterangium stoloniferum]